MRPSTSNMQNNGISFSIDSIISRSDPPKENQLTGIKPLIPSNARIPEVNEESVQMLHCEDQCVSLEKDADKMSDGCELEGTKSTEEKDDSIHSENSDDSQTSE